MALLSGRRKVAEIVGFATMLIPGRCRQLRLPRKHGYPRVAPVSISSPKNFLNGNKTTNRILCNKSLVIPHSHLELPILAKTSSFSQEA